MVDLELKHPIALASWSIAFRAFFNLLLESSADHLKHQAIHDVLTGLPTRALLEDRLKQAISYADRYGRLMAVVFINLDGFKLVNDSLNHKAGDELLKVMAERMSQCLRSVAPSCGQAR
jgi:GGDEF domain-containing protein